jgi:hypothetical protein
MDEVRDFLFGVLSSPPTTSNVNVVTTTKGHQHDGGEATTSTSTTASTRKSGSGRPRKRPLGSEGKVSKKMKLAGKSLFPISGLVICKPIDFRFLERIFLLFQKV